MQNIPRDTTAGVIKTMFIPPPGRLIMQIDYSQAELRVMAAQSKESAMLDAFNAGYDIHLATACRNNKWEYDWALKVLENEDGSDEHKEVKVARKYAKTINFGIIYGQGPKKLAEALDITKEEAADRLKEYYRNNPKVDKFIKRQHNLVKKQGFVKSIFGRKRRLPDIWLTGDQNWSKRAEAERQSVNAPIQGAASDFTQLSAIMIDRQMRLGLLPRIPMFATVHDSLLYYPKPEDIHESVPILKEICRNPSTKEWFDFSITEVEMKVDFEIGSPWNKLKTYSDNTDYLEIGKELNTKN
jgi:DNA polymerase-1